MYSSDPPILNFKQHKGKLTIFIVIFILVLTNPSSQQFDNYVGLKNEKIVLFRSWNFYIFSIYGAIFTGGGSIGNERYVGILGNFFHVKGDDKIERFRKI